MLPDLPLHGDSEDRPRHSYSPDWLAEVLAGFVRDTCGPRPLVGGHETGALLLLRAVASRQITPGAARAHVLVAAPAGRSARTRARAGRGARGRRVPGLDRAASHAARLLFPPERGPALSARGNPAARDLIRHATMDLGGNVNRARAWSKAVAALAARPAGAARRLPPIDVPVLLLWADEDPLHPLAIAEEALDLLPDAMLRVLPGTGFLMAYDDPVGLARELAAFCADAYGAVTLP